jgi:hypothetical protein
LLSPIPGGEGEVKLSFPTAGTVRGGCTKRRAIAIALVAAAVVGVAAILAYAQQRTTT